MNNYPKFKSGPYAGYYNLGIGWEPAAPYIVNVINVDGIVDEVYCGTHKECADYIKEKTAFYARYYPTCTIKIVKAIYE